MSKLNIILIVLIILAFIFSLYANVQVSKLEKAQLTAFKESQIKTMVREEIVSFFNYLQTQQTK